MSSPLLKQFIHMQINYISSHNNNNGEYELDRTQYNIKI